MVSWIQARHGPRCVAESRSCGWAEVHDSLDDSCCDKLDLDIGEVELYGGELDLDGGGPTSDSELIFIGHSDPLLVLEMLHFLKSKLL